MLRTYATVWSAPRGRARVEVPEWRCRDEIYPRRAPPPALAGSPARVRLRAPGRLALRRSARGACREGLRRLRTAPREEPGDTATGGASGLLFRLRDWLGKVLYWDDGPALPIPGCQELSVAERLPIEQRQREPLEHRSVHCACGAPTPSARAVDLRGLRPAGWTPSTPVRHRESSPIRPQPLAGGLIPMNPAFNPSTCRAPARRARGRGSP